MGKTRLEAFSDGVIAIIITIMVLELKVPHGEDLAALVPLIPVFLSYVLSFLYVGIYWNNHHHMLHTVKTVSGGVLWSNLHLLFWLSLFPFATGFMGENHFAPTPSALYGVVLFGAAISYTILQMAIIRSQGKDSLLHAAVGRRLEGQSVARLLRGRHRVDVHGAVRRRRCSTWPSPSSGSCRTRASSARSRIANHETACGRTRRGGRGGGGCRVVAARARRRVARRRNSRACSRRPKSQPRRRRRDSPASRKLDELRTMSESVRNSTFVIAIRAAGFMCEDVVDVYAGADAPAWRARCRDSRAYYVRVADAGELAVEPTLDYFDGVGAPRVVEFDDRGLRDRAPEPLEPRR